MEIDGVTKKISSGDAVLIPQERGTKSPLGTVDPVTVLLCASSRGYLL